MWGMKMLRHVSVLVILVSWCLFALAERPHRVELGPETAAQGEGYKIMDVSVVVPMTTLQELVAREIPVVLQKKGYLKDPNLPAGDAAPKDYHFFFQDFTVNPTNFVLRTCEGSSTECSEKETDQYLHFIMKNFKFEVNLDNFVEQLGSKLESVASVLDNWLPMGESSSSWKDWVHGKIEAKKAASIIEVEELRIVFEDHAKSKDAKMPQTGLMLNNIHVKCTGTGVGVESLCGVAGAATHRDPYIMAKLQTYTWRKVMAYLDLLPMSSLGLLCTQNSGKLRIFLDNYQFPFKMTHGWLMMQFGLFRQDPNSAKGASGAGDHDSLTDLRSKLQNQRMDKWLDELADKYQMFTMEHMMATPPISYPYMPLAFNIDEEIAELAGGDEAKHTKFLVNLAKDFLIDSHSPDGPFRKAFENLVTAQVNNLLQKATGTGIKVGRSPNLFLVDFSNEGKPLATMLAQKYPWKQARTPGAAWDCGYVCDADSVDKCPN